MKKRKSIASAAKLAIAQDEKERSKQLGAATADSFMNLQQGLGVGANNALTTSTYGFNPITRQRNLLEWIYRGSWLGGVSVDVKADDMTRGGVDIIGEMLPQDVQQIEEEAVKLAIWDKLNETIKWGNLYGGAIAVILIDGQDNSTPLRLSTIHEGQFCGLLPLDRWMVDPTLYELVTDYGPDLGMPKYYKVNAIAPALVGQKIHHSRVIRFEGIKLPYWQRLQENMWGISVIERLYDRMIAFDSATTGASQLVFKSYIRNYKIKNLRNIVAAGGDALNGLKKYVDMMRQFQGIEGMTLLDAEDEFSADTHGAFGGLSDILMRFMEQCSGSLQIPLVRLFGQSPSGFSTGDTDLRNYYDTVNQDQEKQLKVGVTKIYKIMSASLGVKIPEGFGISFRSLWQLTEVEKADIANKNTDTILRAEEQGIIEKTTALKELKQQSKSTGIFTNITEEIIKESENELPPLPEDIEPTDELENEIGMGADNNAGTIGRPSPLQPESAPQTNASEKAKDSIDTVKAAGILFVDKEGAMLFLKRSPMAPEGGSWGLPGGHIEAGESEEQAARRETREETGIVYNGPLFKIDNGGGFATYLAQVEERPKVKINDESDNFSWSKPATFVLGDFHPNLERVLQKIGA